MRHGCLSSLKGNSAAGDLALAVERPRTIAKPAICDKRKSTATWSRGGQFPVLCCERCMQIETAWKDFPFGQSVPVLMPIENFAS
jgi:hypothetical protein